MLTAVYLISLFLYAAPLTYAGVGQESMEGVPPVIENLTAVLGMDPEMTWRYTISLAENCVYLFTASMLTFVTFHVAMVLTRESKGMLQSLRVITYSTGIYLAIIFSFAWYLSTADRIDVADEWLIALQVEFLYLVMDLFGVTLELPVSRLAEVETTRLRPIGKLVIVGIFVTGCYYLYSLYLGARINHGASRLSSLVVVAFVVCTPILYIPGFALLLAIEYGGTIQLTIL